VAEVAVAESVVGDKAGVVIAQADAYGTPGLLQLTLSHPGKFNAMSRSMWAALKAIFVAVQADETVRCVLLRGEQGHFCAGGDIAEYPSFRFDEAQLRHFHEHEVWGALQAMLDCDVPIVAQIEGNCMGAGLEIASCCDLRLSADNARFGAPIARLGFPMAQREAALVARVAGETVARAMLLGADLLDAPAMLNHGFVTRLYPPAELAVACRDMAQRVAGLAPQAARLNKQTLRAIKPHLPDTPVEYAQAATDLVASSASSNAFNPYAYANSAEHREGIAAFLAKRPPVF